MPRYRRSKLCRSSSSVAQDSQALPDTLQHCQRLSQVFLRMRCRHDGADTGLALRDCGEGDARAEYAFLKQFAREVHGELAVADDDRGDRSFTRWSRASANIETQQAEFLLPEARVLP